MIKVHYCPSWNGDWRLEADPAALEKRTLLSIVKPTPYEMHQLSQLMEPFIAKGWLDRTDVPMMKDAKFFDKERAITLLGPLSEISPLAMSILQPGPTILTAVRFRDGHTEVCETSRFTEEGPKPEIAADAKAQAKIESKPEPKSEPTPEAKALVAKPDAEKAATVKRSTPCCPNCYVDAIEPATDVLLSFLDEEQHDTWAKDRFLVVRGGYTGHRYLIAHRHSRLAAANTRITFDLDDQQIMHFHDWTVPPEEEVLAAMLILRHREPWLRNEATALGNHTDVFKNPFGDGQDGVRDSLWTQAVGNELLSTLSPLLG